MGINYIESLDYVYHAKQAGAVKNGLVNITELMKRLGNPEARFASVHVAGTNGKGSVCAFLESIARAAGLKTGLYTSPYLERFTERIRIGGEEIDEEDFAAAATGVRQAADQMVREGWGHPTFFELVTACCFLCFAVHKVELAIVETGMGGRTDATNVLHPSLSVITSVGIDHAAALGGTLARIAGEKAGIIKPGVPCVLSGGNEPEVVGVIRQAAASAGTRMIDAGDCFVELHEDNLDGQQFSLSSRSVAMGGLRIGLLGAHQLANAATAVTAAYELAAQGFPLTELSVKKGLAEAKWPGRMEVLRREPPLIIDGAHNPQGASALADAVRRYLPGRPVCLVMGAMADKDAEAIVKQLSLFAAHVIATLPPTMGRQARNAGELAELFRLRHVEASVCEDWRDALALACGTGMAVVVAGSIYLAGAARSWWRSFVAGTDLG